MTLRAGFGRVDITPDYSVHIQGSNWRGRISDGVLDTLYTTCVALSLGDTTLLLYTMDLKVATPNFTVPTKEAVGKAVGIPPEHVLLCATHTHSSVAIRYPWEGVEGYREFFKEACVKAAQEAMADLAEAQVYAGTTETQGLAFVRHYRMNDGSVSGSAFGSTKSGYKCHVREADPQLQVIRLERAGKKDIVLLSFPCHGTFQGNSTKLSADWPSPTRQYIEEHSDSLVAVFQGASGDQTPGSRIPGLAHTDYQLHGQALGSYALQAMPTLKKQSQETLKLHRWSYTGPSNFKNIDKLPQAIEIKELIEQFGPTAKEVNEAVKKYGFSSRYDANWTILRSKEDATNTMELAAVVLGSLAFVLAPYEMFSEQGKFIKANAPFDQAFIITCYNESFNYIASKEAFDYNCYESQCCYFARGVAEDLAQNYVDTLAKMK